MKTLVILLTLILYSKEVVLRRLQTQTQSYFRSGDTLVSTLGQFKMILVKQNCMLRVQMFNYNNNTYSFKGNYVSPNVTTNCDYLQLNNYSLLTNNSQIFLSLPIETESASFTIDDNGLIQLIGSQIGTTDGTVPNNIEATLRNFQIQQKYIQAFSNKTIDQQINGNVINQNNWVFSLVNGQFAIYKRNNTRVNAIFPFAKVNIRASGLYDFNNFQMPAAIFRNVSYQPYCSSPGNYLDFKAPFTFQADPYWPILRFYQQGGYIVKEIAVGNDPSFYFPNQQKQISYYKRYSPCPDYTFLYKNQCVSQCPAPYFHQMYGTIGKCVLICEKSALIDQNQRICSCNLQYQNGKFTSKLITNCPSEAKSTPYGCACLSQNLFYDHKVTLSCVANCPQNTFGKNGICMQCSDKCTKCQIDNMKRYYLSCLECASGYKLQNGKCILQCNRYLGLQLFGGQCQTCLVSNCIDCHVSLDECLACQATFALQQNNCVKNCRPNYQIVHKQTGETVCLAKSTICNAILPSNYKSQALLVCAACPNGYFKFGEQCVLNCPPSFISFNNSYCICEQKDQILIGKKCYNFSACPIKTSYNFRTESCVSCPSGCTSCFQNQCTSCQPGYLLFITPLYVACFRRNPLTTCQKQNGIQQGVCLVNDFAGLSMNLCINRISNCRVCKYKSNDICVLCKADFFLYNNTCTITCPNGTIQYQNTCVLQQIQQCQVPHLMTQRIPFIITLDLILNAPLSYYTYNGLVPFNTPVAYIIIQQNATFIQWDTLTRNSFVTEVTWGCLKCQKGFGLSQQGLCIACPSSCDDCYLARSDSCINNTNQTQICPFRQKNTGKCLQSCSDQNQIPILQNDTLFCVPISQSNIKTVVQIDGAVYTFPNQQKVVYFVFSEQVMGNAPVEVIEKTTLTASQQQKLIQNARSLQQNSTTTKTIQDGSYVLIDSTFKEAFILNFTNSVSKIQTQNGQFLPNSVYGVTNIQSHPQFMKLWLAYIGYVVSIVVIVLHALFIGNDLIYKVDNLLIFIQTFYYFSFVKLLVGKLLAQYYYGWIYAHAGFFPNYFYYLPPNGYFERQAPDSYKIATLDANFFRNGGFSLSFLLTYIVAWLIIIPILYVISHKFKTLNRPEAWNFELAKNSLFAGIEFFSMNIYYWAVANLMYSGGGSQLSNGYYLASIIVLIVMVVIFSIYALVRLYFHFLGGLYMLKRLVIAIILAGAAVNKNVLIVPLLICQVIFFLVRWFKQQPGTLWQRLFIISQQLCIFGLYFLLFFSINAGVNTIILSLFVFIFIVILFGNLSDVYLQSQEQYFIEEKDLDENMPYDNRNKNKEI